MTTHRRRFGIWQCGLYVVKAQSLLYNSIEWVQNSCFHSSIVSFLHLFSLWHFFFPAATIFGSSHIDSFHSPVHDGSVDVDEIDEDSKVEDALDADEASLRLVATK